MAGELYDLLNVPKSATQEEIKKAFKRKAMEYHPDKTNGDKEKEEHFKKINEAYAVLGDPQKRQMYDQFGMVDGQPGGPGMGPGVDLGDILSGMFGGMGGARPGGFSFMFMGDEGGAPEDVFQFFGGGPRARPHPRPADLIEVQVDIHDLFYGKSKKVEFELLDLCNKCQGTGASDPSCVVKCLVCHGSGKVSQQMGPFFMQTIVCHGCGGQGTTIKNNKICQHCKGKKQTFSKRSFELKLPKGIAHGHEVRMEKKGSYDERFKDHRDIIFKFVHHVQPPYTLDEQGNVTLEVPVSLEELLTGFTRKIQVYQEEFTLHSDHYFNPSQKVVVDGLGIFHAKRNKPGDLILHIKVEYGENEKLVKYNDILRKVFKRAPETPSEGDNAELTKSNVIKLTG